MVFEHMLRFEFQERGTLHVHLRGTTGSDHRSILIGWLESMGLQTVDIQGGSGFMNYITKYASKCTDCLDFRPNEHIRNEETISGEWSIVSRKQSPCLPEIYGQFDSFQLMRRTFYVDAVCAPQEVSWTDEFPGKSNQQPRLGSDNWSPGGKLDRRVLREI